jgi:hypothetical protein
MASCAFGLERKCFEKENSHTGNFRDFRTGIQSHTQVLLREELVGAFEENGDRPPYEILQDLPYLDGVINGIYVNRASQ